MSGQWAIDLSERWFRLLLHLYPADFRDDMGDALVETYRDRAREALNRGGLVRLAFVWVRALSDALRNGPGERAHPAVSWRRGGNWGRDVEFATRRLVRAPGFVAATVGTLTVGLGMFAVVYTVVHTILIAPMPYRDAGDLYFVWRDYGTIFDMKRGWLGGPDIAELQKAGGVIEAAVGIDDQAATFAAREGVDPAEITVMAVSPNLFDVLGTSPAIGRGFAAHEVGPGRPPVIILTHPLWNRLGADPAIIGTHVRLNGEPYTVIGVLPESFAFVEHASVGPPVRADAYTTLDVNLAETSPSAASYGGLIRARRGTPPNRVAAAVDAVARIVDARDFRNRGVRLYPVGLRTDLVSPVRPALVVLSSAGVLLVLVLAVNLASVLLARAAQREHEIAVSRALGANTAAVARATLFEGGLLGMLGGMTATLAAIWGSNTLVALAPLDLPRREAIGVDWAIAAVIVAVGVLIGVLAAIAPASWAARSSLATLLASSAVRGGGGHGRLRRGIVVAQVALSLVLLSTGALVVRSFERLLRADPGFVAEGVLTLRVPMPRQLIHETRTALALQERLHQELGAIPGVSGVSAASTLPLTASASQRAITFPGAPGNTGNIERDRPLVDVIGTRAGYIQLMGMRLLDGRPLSAVRREGVREAVIDHLLARQFFPTGSPIGLTIPFDERSLTIVGVVKQARLYDVHQDGRPQVLVRAEDWEIRTLSFVLRTAREPRTLTADVRAVVRRVDPRLAITDMRPMDEVIADSLRQQRISAVLIATFATGALLLAAMGLFGVVSASVTRRRHEFAVRLALGADHGRVLRLMLGDSARLVAIGVVLSVPGIYLAGELIRGVLVGISPSDPPTLVAVAAGLALVAMLASYIPARRVLRIEPAQSLRQE